MWRRWRRRQLRDARRRHDLNPTSTAPLTLNVVAPSDLRIWMLYQETGLSSGYDIWIQPCAQIIGRLGSITALSPDLAAAAGAIDENCSDDGAYTLCQKMLTYDVKAGGVIATISAPTKNALDWWLWDSRTSGYFIDSNFASHFIQNGISEANIAAASAYFMASVTPQIDAKLGRYDGSVQRTDPPIDGTISVDVATTTRGYWYNPNQAWPPENYHAALAPDEVTPSTTQVISLGVSQANFSQGGGSGVRGSFSPVLTGLINRAFEIEIQAKTGGNCAGSQPWAFTSNAVTYKR